MKPEIRAYQHALSVWEDFHAQTKCLVLDEKSLSRSTAKDHMLDCVLRALPPGECTPTAFGLFVRFGSNWSPVRQTSFLGEFLPGPSTVERRLLEAAAKGAIKQPRKYPVTVEEFPSRIWKRAQASQCPNRLVSAAHLAFNAMVRLLEQHEDDTDLEDLMTFRIPSGDLPDVIDFLALPPHRCVNLKNRIIDQFTDEIQAGRIENSTEVMQAFRPWALVDTTEREEGIIRLSSEARATMRKYLTTGSLREHYHTRRLGRLMFRFGLRRLASQCAKVLGHSPWEIGWQFQAISGNAHARIRKMILRPNSGADAWMKEPALACSAMSLPLWLMDGVERVSELTALFNRAAECPWIFSRLQHIYQWHLALADKHEELRQIEQIAPDLAVGLSESLTPSIP